MSELTVFLEARLAEDAAVARMEVEHPFAGPLSLGWVDHGPGSALTIDPARVLVEVEAKRAIVADLLNERHVVCEDGWYTCPAATEDADGGECFDDNRRGTGCDCGRDARLGRRLRLLASVYADHEGYQEGWAL